jgi:hypothetical protein
MWRTGEVGCRKTDRLQGWWQRSGTWLGARDARTVWVVGNSFFEPSPGDQIAGSEYLSLGEQSLRQRLREAGPLASVDEGRKLLQVSQTLEGFTTGSPSDSRGCPDSTAMRPNHCRICRAFLLQVVPNYCDFDDGIGRKAFSGAFIGAGSKILESQRSFRRSPLDRGSYSALTII